MNFFLHVAIELETEVRVLNLTQEMPLSQAGHVGTYPEKGLGLGLCKAAQGAWWGIRWQLVAELGCIHMHDMTGLSEIWSPL